MRLLYKYLLPQRLEYFSNETLRFTQPGDLNDPFEVRFKTDPQSARELLYSYCKTEVERLQADTSIGEEQRSQSIDAVLVKTGSALQDLRHYTAEVEKLTWDSFNEKTGILSLSERCDISLMWAHYTDRHQGFCIGFDSSHDFFTQYKGSMSKAESVSYTDKLPVYSPAGIPPMDYRVAFTKSREWEYEREWRMVVHHSHLHDPPLPPANPGGMPIHCYTVPYTSVVEILLGARCSNQVTIDAIEDFAAARKVKLYKMELCPDSYRLSKVPYRV